jgi:hypothetical protein
MGMMDEKTQMSIILRDRPFEYSSYSHKAAVLLGPYLGKVKGIFPTQSGNNETWPEKYYPNSFHQPECYAVEPVGC